MEKDKVKGIYHTHTKYSKYRHGKSSVQEMVKEANSLGLEEYAITDHGPKHVFGIRKKNIKKLRAEIDEAQKTSSTKILMGLECNLLGANGETDLPSEYNDLLDIRLLGTHKAGRVTVKNLFKFILPNLFRGKSEKVIQMNTDAYIKAIKENKIDIVTHPMEYIRVDLKRLGQACSENNCYLEINNKHLKYTKSDIQTLLETDVKFIVSSDAHHYNKILLVDSALEFAKECEIPHDRIANYDKLPDFANKY